MDKIPSAFSTTASHRLNLTNLHCKATWYLNCWLGFLLFVYTVHSLLSTLLSSSYPVLSSRLAAVTDNENEMLDRPGKSTTRAWKERETDKGISAPAQSFIKYNYIIKRTN